MQDIYFRDEGKGFPLVLIHGFLGSSKMWKPQIDFFKQNFRVIAPDLPGFGQSNQVKSLMGPFLTPVQSLMSHVFIRAFLFAVMVWSCCYSKDMNLFFILAIYFVISRR